LWAVGWSLSLFLIVALVAVVAIKGRGLDKESQHYADVSIVAIITNWNEGALMDRTSPEFVKACLRAVYIRVVQQRRQPRAAATLPRIEGAGEHVFLGREGHDYYRCIYCARLIHSGPC